MTTTTVLEALKQAREALESCESWRATDVDGDRYTRYRYNIEKVDAALAALRAAKPDQDAAPAAELQHLLTEQFSHCAPMYPGDLYAWAHAALLWRAKPDQVDATAQDFVLVPKEPTKEMLVALEELDHDEDYAELKAYRAMLAAVPQPAQAQQEPVAHDPVAEFQNEMAQHWAVCGFVPDGANPDHIYAAMNSGFTGGWNAALQTAAQPVQPITDEREAFDDALDADAMLELRNRVLEEAARVAESHSLAEQLTRMTMANPVTHSLNLVRVIAAAIRSLRSPHIEVREQAPEKVGQA